MAEEFDTYEKYELSMLWLIRQQWLFKMQAEQIAFQVSKLFDSGESSGQRSADVLSTKGKVSSDSMLSSMGLDL